VPSFYEWLSAYFLGYDFRLTYVPKLWVFSQGGTVGVAVGFVVKV